MVFTAPLAKSISNERGRQRVHGFHREHGQCISTMDFGFIHPFGKPDWGFMLSLA
jgi:hypothetical protein